MPRGPRGRLTATDAALWKAVTADVAPLRPEDIAEAAPEIAPDPPPAEPAPAATPMPDRSAKPVPGPPLAPLDRRLRQRLARGTVAPEARIDLHGLTQAEAHRRLVGFLAGAQARGHRLVLVITGKGRASGRREADERGVLRRLVPQWLALPELRPFVLGFEPAQRTHGGDGALYVRLRRAGREHFPML
jgi:DNA-nicking Smr family endonuclease